MLRKSGFLTRWLRLPSLLLVLLTTLVLVTTLPAATGDTTADRVLGQAVFTLNGQNFVDGAGFNYSNGSIGNYPGADGIAVDTSSATHHLYLVDPLNSRMLGWNNAESFASGQAADLVIGQVDMFHSECDYPATVSRTRPPPIFAFRPASRWTPTAIFTLQTSTIIAFSSTTLPTPPTLGSDRPARRRLRARTSCRRTWCSASSAPAVRRLRPRLQRQPWRRGGDLQRRNVRDPRASASIRRPTIFTLPTLSTIAWWCFSILWQRRRDAGSVRPSRR